MSKKSVPVIYLTKDKLEVYQVNLKPVKEAVKIAEGVWDNADLSKVIKNLKEKLAVNKVRALLADDLSHSLELKIDKDIKNPRQFIKKQLSQKIPEEFSDQDWDYKVVSHKLDQNEVRVFAPVKSFWDKFSQAISQAKIELEAVEPVSFAKKRHDNPVIGLGLKKDLKGKDEEVLNMEPSDSKPKPASFDYVDKPALSKPPFVSKKTLITFVVALSLGGLIVGGISSAINSNNKKNQPSSSPIAVASPEPIASPAAEEEVILSDYKVLVLNGIGEAGAAGTVKDLLEAEDFESVDTDNADEFNATKTTIALKQTTPEKVFEVIQTAINDNYEINRLEELLTEDSDYDVVITVGEKQ